jgi:sensor histidine kinase regulating citrate/malate metabolism
MRPSAYCENMTVNTLVAYHFEQAREKGIACSSTLYVPENLAVPTDELAVILGNALENAVKGAESTESGYIRFDAKPVKDCIVFDLENTYRPGAYPRGYGVGLSSIRELCEKNQGRAKVEDTGRVFRLNIVLRLSA